MNTGGKISNLIDELDTVIAVMWLERTMARIGQLHWWQLMTAGEWSYQRSINTLHDVYPTGTVVWYE